MNDERSLLQRASQLDEKALVEVFDCYHAGIYRYAMRLTGEAHLAEECTSETFLRFLNALHKGMGPREHLQAYLYRIAHNWITDHYRSNNSRKEVQLSPDWQDDQTEEPAEATVARRGAVRDAPVDDDQRAAGAFRLAVKIWPDFGLEHDDDRGPDGPQDAAHGETVVDGRIEDSADDGGEFLVREGAACESCGGDKQRRRRERAPEAAQQAGSGEHLADRDGVDPDGSRSGAFAGVRNEA